MQKFIRFFSFILYGISMGLLVLVWIHQIKLLLGVEQSTSGLVLMVVLIGMGVSCLRLWHNAERFLKSTVLSDLFTLAAVVLITWLLAFAKVIIPLLPGMLTQPWLMPFILAIILFVIAENLSKVLFSSISHVGENTRSNSDRVTNETSAGSSGATLFGALIVGSAICSAVSSLLWTRVGVQWSTLLAGGIGVVAWGLSYGLSSTQNNSSRSDMITDGTTSDEAPSFGAVLPEIPFSARFVPWAYAISGFATVAVLVVWMRILTVFVQDQRMALTHLVSLLLLGLGIGLWLGAWRSAQRRRQDRAPELSQIVDLQMIWALVGLGTLFLFALLPSISQPFLQENGSISRFYPFFLGTLTLLFPTILMGMTYPIVLDIVAFHRGQTIAHTLSQITGLYLVGGGLGIGFALFGLIPLIGLQGTGAVLAGIGLTTGLISSWVARASGEKGSQLPHLGMAGGIALVLLLPQGHYVSPQQLPNAEVLFYDDSQTPMAVMAPASGEAAEESLQETVARPRLILHNGQIMGCRGASNLQHDLVVELARALAPKPARMLVLDFECGELVRQLAGQEISHIDGIAPFPQFVQAALFFDAENEQILQSPLFTSIITDQRGFLQQATTQYDLILSGPVDPHRNNGWPLVTQEFYQQVTDRLTEKGVFIQQIGSPQLAETDLKRILVTFQRIFTYPTLLVVGSENTGDKKMIFIATPDPVGLDRLSKLLTDALPEALSIQSGRTKEKRDVTMMASAQVQDFVGSSEPLEDDRIYLWATDD
ncbi:MAG: hypothetical protein AAF702_37070 [Chloroflexota bacterium]